MVDEEVPGSMLARVIGKKSFLNWFFRMNFVGLVLIGVFLV